MVHLLRLEESRFIDPQGRKMLHRAVDGRLYIGPPIWAQRNDKVFLDVAAKPGPNGYYRIHKVLMIVPDREWAA